MTLNAHLKIYPSYRFLAVVSLIYLALAGCTSIRPNQAIVNDYQGNVLSLSSIFDWYEDDFIAWQKKHSPEQEANPVNFVIGYLPQETAQSIREGFDDITIIFMPYDWGLNDQDRKQ